MIAPPAGVHRRFNPLTGGWVLVSPHRASRPWQGQHETPRLATGLAHDPSCYLCPGNARANGQHNPDYSGVFVFDNDFPALQEDAPATLQADDPLFAAEAAHGTCRVICYSPHHTRGLADLCAPERRAIVDCWAAQCEELGRTHAWVQVFENRGAMMGCSNPHPHGQVWASGHLPSEVLTEDERQRAWFSAHGESLLLQVATREADGERAVLMNAHWIAVVPWWASWPFETLLLPRTAVARLEQLDAAQRDALASLLGALTAGYDALFDCEFPYTMGWHGAPPRAAESAHWQLHAHVYPPLLRSASIRKFMVGYEMLAEAQRDITPEQAAERLRAAIGDRG